VLSTKLLIIVYTFSVCTLVIHFLTQKQQHQQNKQTNKRTNKQTNKEPSRQTNRQTDKRHVLITMITRRPILNHLPQYKMRVKIHKTTATSKLNSKTKQQRLSYLTLNGKPSNLATCLLEDDS